MRVGKAAGPTDECAATEESRQASHPTTRARMARPKAMTKPALSGAGLGGGEGRSLMVGIPGRGGGIGA